MYVNWSKRLQTAKQLRWYEANATIETLYKLQETIFLTPGKISINYMPYFEPAKQLFDKHRRFPKEGIFLCNGIGDWTDKLNHLQLAFSLIAFPNRLERQYKGIETRGDAEYYLLAMIDDILTSIEQNTDMFDQDAFETYYGLEWVEEDQENTLINTMTTSTANDPSSSSSSFSNMTTRPIPTTVPLTSFASSNSSNMKVSALTNPPVPTSTVINQPTK